MEREPDVLIRLYEGNLDYCHVIGKTPAGYAWLDRTLGRRRGAPWTIDFAKNLEFMAHAKRDGVIAETEVASKSSGPGSTAFIAASATYGIAILVRIAAFAFLLLGIFVLIFKSVGLGLMIIGGSTIAAFLGGTIESLLDRILRR